MKLLSAYLYVGLLDVYCLWIYVFDVGCFCSDCLLWVDLLILICCDFGDCWLEFAFLLFD